MNKFEKISFEQYKIGATEPNDFSLRREYDDIKLPQRATRWSAGYDFFAPFTFTLNPHERVKVGTGIKVHLDADKWLMCAPRSGLGFKYGVMLVNTIGVIDADYAEASNEGHIFLKLTNTGDKPLVINKGDAFAQGIILSYAITDDDNAGGIRTGGFGSTNK